jgi:hypothetical protein
MFPHRSRIEHRNTENNTVDGLAPTFSPLVRRRGGCILGRVCQTGQSRGTSRSALPRDASVNAFVQMARFTDVMLPVKSPDATEPETVSHYCGHPLVPSYYFQTAGTGQIGHFPSSVPDSS